MESWIGTSIYEWLEGLCNDFLDYISGALNTMFEYGEELVSCEEVSFVTTFTSDIATILISIVVLYNIISIYIFETSGDADQDPIQQLVNASMAIALIQSSNFLFKWVLEIANTFSDELLKKAAVTIQPIGGIVDAIETAQGAGVMAQSLWIIVLIILSIGFSVLAFKAYLRGGELALMKMFFPIFCCDLLTHGKERFNTFFTAFCVTSFSYGIQLLCFRMCLVNFINIREYFSMFQGFIWLYFAIKAPKWLEKYTYSSGLGGIARTGATSTGQVLTSMVARKVA